MKSILLLIAVFIFISGNAQLTVLKKSKSETESPVNSVKKNGVKTYSAEQMIKNYSVQPDGSPVVMSIPNNMMVYVGNNPQMLWLYGAFVSGGMIFAEFNFNLSSCAAQSYPLVQCDLEGGRSYLFDFAVNAEMNTSFAISGSYSGTCTPKNGHVSFVFTPDKSANYRIQLTAQQGMPWELWGVSYVKLKGKVM